MATPAITPPRQQDRPAGWWCYALIWAFVAWIAPMVTSRLDWWWLPAIGLAVGVLGIALVRVLWPRVLYGPLTGQAQLFAMVLGIALAGWLIRVRLLGGDPLAVWQDWLVGSAALGAWWIVLALWAPKAAADMDARRRNLPPEPPAEDKPIGGVFHDILKKSGLIPAMRIVRVESSPSGGVQSVHIQPVDLPDKPIATFDTLRNKLSTIATHADRLLNQDGYDIDFDEDDVSPEKVTSSRWILHFTVKRVLTGSFPYPIRTTPRAPGDPLNLGKYETDKPLELSTFTPDHGASHLDLVAGTGGSKTTCLHCLIAEDNASDSWEVWLFASQKLTHLAWPWIRPWLQGLVDRPPVNAVFGESQDRILLGLAWACQLASDWNTETDGVREVAPGRAGLTVAIDESSDCLTKPDKIRFRMGANVVEMNASEMVSKLAEIGRTSPIKVVRASQYGLFDSAGSAGHKSRRNFLAAIIGKVMRQSDANGVAPAMPPGWNPVNLRDYMIYVQPNLEEPTVLRAKAWALYKKFVDPVAIAYTKWRNGLDPLATAELHRGKDGGTYANRWDPRYHRELVMFAKANGLNWPVAPGQTTAPTATLNGGPTTPTTSPATPVTVPATPAGPPNQEDPVATDDLPPLPADALPPGWDDDAFDFEAFTGITGEPADQAPKSGSVIANPDLSGIQRAKRQLGAETMRLAKLTRLPDPLGRILHLLMSPKAKRLVDAGWVPTDMLAVAFGRVDADADKDARKKAVTQLGWEINKATGLNSAELPRPVLAQLELDRCYGWRIDELRAVGDRLMAAIPDEEVA
jgi:hypothetical protein